MINVIHGQDTLASRNFYNSQKTKDSLIFDAESISLIDLSQSVQGLSLFDSNKKIFIDNLFSRKTKNLEEITELLANAKDVDFYLYADKEVGLKLLNLLGKPTSHNFKFKESIFTFLDGIRPNNTRNIVLFRDALSSSEPEIILFMLGRQVRLLLSQLSQGDQIEEAKRLAPWQKDKLLRQARLFGEDKLLSFHKKLYKLEKNFKTGASKLDIAASIDILLLEI